MEPSADHRGPAPAMSENCPAATMTGIDQPRSLIDDIVRDLTRGRLLGLTELYAVGALGSAGESVVDEYLRSASAERCNLFARRVAQTREALSLSYGCVDADPPPDLLRKVLDRLPTAFPDP